MISKFLSKLFSKIFTAGFLSFAGYEVGTHTNPTILVKEEVSTQEKPKDFDLTNYLVGLCVIVFIAISFALIKEIILCAKQEKKNNNIEMSSSSGSTSRTRS